MSHPTHQITLATTADVVASLPALVSYQPSHALVAVLLQRLHLVCTLCQPLPDDLVTTAGRVVRAAQLAGADEAFLAVYTPRSKQDLPHSDEVAAVVDEVSRHGIAVRDAVLVDDGRYWSYTDAGQPIEGTPYPQSTTALEALRVAHGQLASAASRHDLEHAYRPRPDLAPPPEAMQAAAALLTLPTADRCRIVFQAVSTLARRPSPTAGAQQLLRAQLALLVAHDVLVRDYLLCRVATHPDADALVDAVATTALRAPEQHREPIAATAAALLATRGTNPVATWALLALAEQESLAGLVRDALRLGLPPDELRHVYAATLDEVQHRINRAT